MSQPSPLFNDGPVADPVFPADPIRSAREDWIGDVSDGEEGAQPERRIYCHYADTKFESREDLLDRLSSMLVDELKSGRNRFAVPEADRDNPLWTFERIVMGCGEDGSEPRSVFLSNCSTVRSSDFLCHEPACPLDGLSECCRASVPCEYLLIRPKRNLPSLARMFPGREVLALKIRLEGCPASAEGCRAAIVNLVWAPAGDARPFEREAVVVFPSRAAQSGGPDGVLRPGNLLTASFLSSLPPMSAETRERLEEWFNYLDWKDRLLSANARGIRYFRTWKNEDGTRSFLVVSDGSEKNAPPGWFRKAEIEAVPLGASSDPWSYRERELDPVQRKTLGRPALLGESDSVRAAEGADAPPVPDGCPWAQPVFAEVRFDVEGNDVRPGGKIPDEGFLRICQRGDRSLVNRTRKVLDRFALQGSDEAPFLSSYLFDISQARLPAKSETIDSFVNPDLTEDQKRAVQTMVDAPDIGLVQGPPGTGKTTVIREAIIQFVRRGKRVLVASQSIIAVENVFNELEHVPEVRACLRRKAKPGVRPNEDREDPFSDGALLRAHYDALGKNARETLELLDGRMAKATAFRAISSVLAPIADRIAQEGEIEAAAVEETARAEEEIRSAEARVRANRASMLALEAAESLRNELPSLTPSRLGDWSARVPAEAVDAVAGFLGRTGEALAACGVDLWSALGRDEPHRPSDIRLRNLAAAAERLHQFREAGFPALRDVIRGWAEATGDRLVDDETLRRVQELRLACKEAEKKAEEADAAGKTDVADGLYAEARELRKRIHEAQATSRTNTVLFREWFTLPGTDGKTLAEAIDGASGWRADVLDLVRGVERKIADILAESATAEQAVAETIGRSSSRIVPDDAAEHDLRAARRKRDDAATRASEARRRARDFAEQAMPELERLRADNPEAPSDPEAARAWCDRMAEESEREAEISRKERPWCEPLFREWVRLTANPNEADRERVLPAYLRNCNVVGITCTADSRLLGGDVPGRFDVVIIDEVSKAMPPELIAPMMLGAKTILVGDHRQLPPLFGDKEPISMEEEIARQEEADDTVPEELKIVKENFRKYRDIVEASFFKRIFEDADPRLKSMLWVQHRMHPDIMEMVNVFYDNRLKCGLSEGREDILRDHSQRENLVSWISRNRHAFWIDSTVDPSGRPFWEEESGTSYVNRLEVRLVCKALKDLDAGVEGRKGADGKPMRKSVGVISFYGKQKSLLYCSIRELGLRNLDWKVETVDRFQGWNRDYVLVSMTRNRKGAPQGKHSFVARFERINVAFSRARELLLVFGAKGFFDRQPVVLPALDGSGNGRDALVYRQIADNLARKGALRKACDIIPADEWTPPDPSPARREKTFDRSGSGRRIVRSVSRTAASRANVQRSVRPRTGKNAEFFLPKRQRPFR